MGVEPVGRLPEEDGPVSFLPRVRVPHLSDFELTCDMRAAQARVRRNRALELEAIAQLAHRRRCRVREPAAADGRGEPGMDSRAPAEAVLSGVAEDFAAELAVSRDCSEAEAQALLREALLLTGPLTPVWSALYAGWIGERHVRAAVDLLGDVPAEVAAVVQARVLPRVEGVTAAVFRDRLRAGLYRVDAEARERRRRQALTRIGVHVRRIEEGVSELVLQGPTAAVHAAASAVDGYARLRRADGDTRPIGVLRAQTALDLILRPWDTARPPVTAQLVLHAPVRALRPDADRSRQPGELDGQLVSAAECRDLLHELAMIGLAAPPAGGTVLISADHPVTGETLAVATPGELHRAGRNSDGPGLSLPPDTGGYRPTAAQRRHVHVRDRRCRMPGCRRRPVRLDLDHTRPHASGGPTACWNLCCLCRRHHRIKTHAPGWAFTLLRDGTLLVRTPSGITRHTRPPGWWHDPEPDPPWHDELAPPDPLRS